MALDSNLGSLGAGRRSARLVAAVAALLAVACSASEPAVSASGQLDSLIEQYVESQRGGGRGSQDPIGDLSAAAFVHQIESQRQLLEAVREVDVDDLEGAASIDQRLLVGLLESSVRASETRRGWENDPAVYVPSEPIGRLLDPQAAGTPAQRAADLTAVFERIAAMLEHGRANLKRPPRRFTEAAIFQTESTIATLHDGVPRLGEQEGVDGSALKVVAEAATAELEHYLRFLRHDVVPRSDGEWAIGKQEYDYILAHRWFLEDDAEAILERGRRAFQQTEALAQQVAERIEPGASWVEVYEHLKDDHPPAAEIKQAYQQQMDAARDFLIANQIVTLPAGERVITVDTPPAMRRSSPFGTFQTAAPGSGELEGRLVLTPIEDWMSPEQRAERLRSHHRAWVPIIAVHEAYPGHHVQALKTNANPRLLRTAVHESIFSEGWGLFTEELMFDLGFLQGDDVRLTQLRNRLWRAARVILDVSLHTGRMSIEEAVDFLVDKVRFERYAAELEVGMYPRRPTYVLGYLIGMQEIAAIRDDYIEAFGEPSPPSQFYDRLLSIGAIPPSLVRADLFGQLYSEAPTDTGANE